MGKIAPSILLTAALLCSGAHAQERDRVTQEPGSVTNDGRLAPWLENLGTLHVPTSTRNPDAQRYFDQGMRLIYGFNHAEALRSFREAARLDDGLAIAYWGQALALAPNINDSAIGPDREQQGYGAIREAVKRRAAATPRERVLIDALAQRFAESVSSDGRQQLNEAYARAMRAAAGRFPKDPDIAVLYADSVMNTRPWDYWTKDGKPQPGIAEARASLEGAIRLYPEHPGAHHIYIHLMEASDLIDLATPSADKLGALMPGAGHLVHMPSHVYIRTGRYSDAAAANIKAIAADEAYITQCRAQGIYPAGYYPHNIHFLTAALVMEGRSANAVEAARKAASKHAHDGADEGLAGFSNLLDSLPLMTMVRFGSWRQIEQQPEPPAEQPFVRSIYHFARGMAFSAAGRQDRAKVELALSERFASSPAIKEMKILDLNPLGELAAIGTLILRGDIAVKAGSHREAVAAFTEAVERDDALLYSEPPDWLLPPRHFLAQAYLEAGQPAQAERVYREDLRRHRENGWSLQGLEAALREQGKTAEAEQTKERFERAWQTADLKLTGSRF